MSEEKMVQLPDGCLVPAKRECELCNKITSILELEWHTVHNHPFYLACSKCRRGMEKWKPLPGARKDDDPDTVSVRIGPKRARSPSMPEEYRRRQEKEKQSEPFTFELDTDLSLDDLEEPE